MRFRLFCCLTLFAMLLGATTAQAAPPLPFQADTTKAAEKKDRPLSLEPDRIHRFTTNEGSWISLDVSPDGSTLVFELLGDLYTLPIGGGQATAITSGMAFDSQPRYAPSGDKIVFVSDRDGSENLWIMDVGSMIADTTAASDSTGLKQLTKGGDKGYMSPEWSPDGRYIVASNSGGLGVNKPWMYHVEGGTGVDLIADKETQNVAGMAFSSDGRYIYSASKTGGFGYNLGTFDWQIHVYDRETGELFKLTGEVGGGFRPALSPDGQWLVYASRHEGETGFRVRNLAATTEDWLLYPVQRDEQESRFTRDLMPGYAFTPDSRAIITSFNGRIYRVEVPDGTVSEIPFTAQVALALGPKVDFDRPLDDGPVQLRQIRWPRLSPDGTKLAFTALNKLYLRDVASGRTEPLAEELAVGQFAPAWSPDGSALAFVTWSDDGGGELYKVEVANKQLTRLSTHSAHYNDPVWRPDGSEVIVAKAPWQQRQALNYFTFVQGQGMDLVRIPQAGGEATVISPLRGGQPHFADDPDRIYVYEGQEGLISMRLDGTDRKVHVKVVGTTPTLGGGSGQPLPAAEVVMGPDGEQAMARVNNHLYKVTVPKVGGDPATINVLNPEGATFPVEKLTTVGGEYTHWVADGSGLTWSLGPTFFQYDFAAADAFEAPDDDEEDAPDQYTAEELTIEMTFPRHRAQGTVVLRGARLLTMDPSVPNDGVIEDGAVVIENNRIKEIGPSSEVETPSGAQELDVSGTTLTPGFIDTHAHMWPPRGVHRGIVWEYLANLAYGVTTTRDPQTGTTDVLTYGNLVETGALLGPRIFSTGPGIFRSEGIKNQKEADYTLDRYADYFKTNTIKQYVSGDRKVRQWIIKAAREREIMPTTEGALDLKLNLTHMIDGYSGHEHSFPVVPLYNDVVELVVASGTHYTPTLLVSYGGPWAENYFYTSTEVRNNEKLRRFVPEAELLKATRSRPWFHASEHVFSRLAEQANKIVEAGGMVGVGSHGQLQGLGYHWELWSVASGGMTPMNALRTATVMGASAIGLEDQVGMLKAGMLADVLVMGENPLEDLENTLSLQYVIKDGFVYDAETLNQVWPQQTPLPMPYWQEDTGPPVSTIAKPKG